MLYDGLLILTAVCVLLVCPKSDHCPGRGRPMAEMLTPLKHVRVWRLSLYYLVVFGAYVALSAWLPNYYRNTFGVDLRTAALLTALHVLQASLLRPLGGYLSDLYRPRVVTYAVFIAMTVVLVPLWQPTSVLDLGLVGFTALMLVVGVGTRIGKASVFKYVPNYNPRDVGATGGLVGALGAQGGCFLPSVFGMVGRSTGSPQSAFVALLALTVGALVWLHLVVLSHKRTAARLTTEPDLATAGVGS
ncbi:MAG: MFS transporter [Gemmataceae bacterium]